LRGGHLRTGLRGAALAAAIGCATPAFPQAGLAAAQAEFDVLFQRLLVDPGNRDTNLRFIEVALQLGDKEAAIGALERLLFYAPDDPNLHYQLGVLYYEIGSYTVAQSYFDSVVEIAGTPPELRAAAVTRAAEAERRTRPSPWALYAEAGLRYQTNANAAPDDEVVPGAETKEADWNSYVLVSAYLTQPLGEHFFEAGLIGYYADQFEIDRLDLGLVELNAGPRLTLWSGEGGSFSVRPYGHLGGMLLGDEAYRRTLGGGVSARAAFGDSASLEPYVEYRDRKFYDTDDYPTDSDRTGELVTYAVYGTAAPGDAVRWTARGGFNDNDAEAEHHSYDEYFIDMSMRLQFDPFAASARPWALTPFAAAYWTDYAAPDPVDPATEREDFEWRAGARLDVPFGEHAGLGILMQYNVNNSNVRQFEYDNLQVTAGPTVSF
jgi:hypothetical protein